MKNISDHLLFLPFAPPPQQPRGEQTQQHKNESKLKDKKFMSKRYME
jgi:hypothetical protein